MKNKAPKEFHNEGPGLGFWLPTLMLLGGVGWILIAMGGIKACGWYLERPYWEAVQIKK